MLTAGAARIVEPFRITDSNELLHTPSSGGPRQVLRQVRRLEASDPDAWRWPRYKPRGDTTVAYLTVGDTNATN